MRYRRRDTRSKAGCLQYEGRARLRIATLALVAGCAASQPPGTAPSMAPVGDSAFGVAVAQRLYFGRNIPGGGSVSDGAWDTFLAEVVSPRFPDGFTVWRANGQWRGDDGTIVREATFVLEVIHPAGTAAELAIREIASEYRRRFQQEAVLWVRDEVRMSLEGN